MRILGNSELNSQLVETEVIIPRNPTHNPQNNFPTLYISIFVIQVEVERVERAPGNQLVSPPMDNEALQLPTTLPKTPNDFRHRRKTGGSPRFIWVIGIRNFIHNYYI